MIKTEAEKLLLDIHKNSKVLESLALKCAKRPGALDDLNQKKAIDLATKITLRLIDYEYYESANTITTSFCNSNMGPFKSAGVIAITDSLIAHKQYLLATNIGLLLCPLKGIIKSKTVKHIAIKLKKSNQVIYVNKIYKSLLNNTADYAQLTASQILNSSSKSSLDINSMLNDIDKYLIQIENKAIHCAKRGGSADDLSQKKSIDLATKIGLKLTESGYYKSAFNIAICVCNISMGPFKAALAQAITNSLIENKQFKLATIIALKTATVKGKLKTETVKHIAFKLKENKQHDYVFEIYKALQKNPAYYAQLAAEDILNNTAESSLNLDELLLNLDQNLMQLEKIGVKNARRGGSIDDPDQKKAIDTATKIGISLVKNKQYQAAFNIVKNVCNVSMGPFKSQCTLEILTELIKHNQHKYAEKAALLIALIKDKIIIDTTYKLTQLLIQKNHITNAKNIFNLFKKNRHPYASNAINKLKALLHNRNSKTSRFAQSLKENTSKVLQDKLKKDGSVIVSQINIDQLASKNNLSTLTPHPSDLGYFHENSNNHSNSLATAFKNTFGSLIEDNQKSVSWNNKHFCKLDADLFSLTLTKNKIIYKKGGDFSTVVICFDFQTGKCTKNKHSLQIEDIEKYTLIFFKIIDNEIEYKNNYYVET